MCTPVCPGRASWLANLTGCTWVLPPRFDLEVSLCSPPAASCARSGSPHSSPRCSTRSPLASASIAIRHLAAYICSYTGAALPTALRRPLIEATAGLLLLPARTPDEERAAAAAVERRARGAPPGVKREVAELPRREWARNMLMYTCATDAVLRDLYIACFAGVVPALDGPFEGTSAMKFVILMAALYWSAIRQSDSAAGPQLAHLALEVILRGHGLCGSPFALAGGRAEADRILPLWRTRDLAALVRHGDALVTARVGTPARRSLLLPAGMPPPEPPAAPESYASLPPLYNNKGVYAEKKVSDEIGMRFVRIARQLRRCGATHLTVLYNTKHSQRPLAAPIDREVYAPGLYGALTGWPEAGAKCAATQSCSAHTLNT
jgi:hypothetical protein